MEQEILAEFLKRVGHAIAVINWGSLSLPILCCKYIKLIEFKSKGRASFPLPLLSTCIFSRIVWQPF
jgi:hypothetical protein